MELLEKAEKTGFPVIKDSSEIKVNPGAARMLPNTPDRLGLEVQGDILRVAVTFVPTPGQLGEIQKQAGTNIVVEVTTEDILSQLRGQLTGTKDAPWSIAPAMELAIKKKASDLHLSVGQAPRLRINGTLHPIKNHAVLSAVDMKEAAEWILGQELEDSFEGDLDTAITFMKRRWRVSIFLQKQSLAMALRLLPPRPPRLTDLLLPESVVKLSTLYSGLILICGQTGAGKSTTMAGIVNRINRERAAHIITIEDPIEYTHASARSMVAQREVGKDTESFATGLRSALRQDPDVILVGELRDLETMRTALAAAETGHLVLATVHANSAASALTRIISSFPGEEQVQVRSQLAASLQASVYQLLLPAIRRENGENIKTRALATEVIVANASVRTYIRDDKLHSIGTVIDSSAKDGMVSLDKSLATLVNDGIVPINIAERYIKDQHTFNQYVTQTPTFDLGSLEEQEIGL